MGFFRNLFAREPNSAQLAKDRLVKVLVTDHLALTPGTMEAIKLEIMQVISRHLDIDPEGVEVAVERRGHSDELVATLPVRRNLGKTRGGEPVPVQRPASSVAAPAQAVGRSARHQASGGRSAGRRRH
jgi:cell division topological specificity factor